MIDNINLTINQASCVLYSLSNETNQLCKEDIMILSLMKFYILLLLFS